MVQNQIANQVGNVVTSYALTLTYFDLQCQGCQKCEKVIEKEASLQIDSDPTFQVKMGHDSQLGLICKIEDFRKAANALLLESKELLLSGAHIQFALSVATYEDVAEYEEQTPYGSIKSTLNPLVYNRWEYDGANGYSDKGDCYFDEEEGSLYLVPDPQYTDERHSINLPWHQDVLTSLAEANL